MSTIIFPHYPHHAAIHEHATRHLVDPDDPSGDSIRGVVLQFDGVPELRTAAQHTLTGKVYVAHKLLHNERNAALNAANGFAQDLARFLRRIKWLDEAFDDNHVANAFESAVVLAHGAQRALDASRAIDPAHHAANQARNARAWLETHGAPPYPPNRQGA